MPKVEAPARRTVQLPEEVVQAIDDFAQRVNLSRNKAATALLRLGLKAEQQRFERIRELTKQIRHAPTDEQADQIMPELMETVFGQPQKRAKN
jgi:metal-responsive CopG/Arc/MetJ family transcriptional regulator